MALTDRQIPDPPDPTLPNVGFVRLSTILAVYPVGRSTWWAGVKTGRFPAPVKLGPRVTAWPVEAIRELIEGHQAGDERLKPPPTFTRFAGRARRRTS